MEKRWTFLAKFEQNFNHYVKVCEPTLDEAQLHELMRIIYEQLHHDIVQYLATSETTALLALVVRLNSARPS
jgi:hypothetical protein